MAAGLEREAGRGALTFAVQRAIFCPECQKVLDVRRAILVTRLTEPRAASVACIPCFEALPITLADLARVGLEVDDGRELF